MALMAAAMMMTSTSNPVVRTEIRKNPPETWKLKKCKSCKSFPCNDIKHKWKSNPMAQACEKHQPKNKR